MTALVLSLCVFAFLTLVGSAVLALLAKEEEPLYRLLLAPVTGAVTTMLLIFVLSQAGVPAARFGTAMAVGLVVGSAAVLWRWGRPARWQDWVPYGLLLVATLLAIGWPMLRYGLDWVSFCNDDMANYCLGADRLLHHGYYDPPDAAALAGSDYTQLTWFLHVRYRPGSELFLATVSAVTRLGSLRIFMPVIVALSLCQVSGAAAMTWTASRSRTAVWCVWVLMTVSALVTLGTLYQLIAQVIGLGIAAGLVSLLLRPLQDLPTPRRFRHAALIGLMGAGLLVAYTEVVPFVALAYFLYLAVTLRGEWAGWRRVGVALGVAAGVAVVLLNRFLPLAIAYLLGQVGGGAKSEDPAATMFPYYMLPAGPVYFWGLFAIGRVLPSDALMSTWIVVALALSAGSAALVCRSALRRQGPAFVCVVMGAVWAVLFAKHAGFGMYKLAMYFQPFILAALVLGWTSLWRSRTAQVLPLMLVAAANVPSQRFYMRMSLGLDQVFSEIPAASSSHVVREYADLLRARPRGALELDTFNSTLAKFQMIESVGRPAMFPSNNFLPLVDPSRVDARLVGRQSADAGMAVGRAFEREYPTRTFDMRPRAGTSEPGADPFWLVREGQAAVEGGDGPGDSTLFVACTGRQVAFNRWHDPDGRGTNFRAGPPGSFADHLIFVASDLGQPYFRAGAPRIAIYQLEPDLVFPGRTMAAAGRCLLFRVVNPSTRCRLELDLTDTFAGDGENRLPRADAVGAARVSFPLTGRGSARVFSAPLTPQVIDGIPFVAIDMGTDGAYINDARGGLMKLWGGNIRLDRRQIVGFVRDISLVADEDYRQILAPALVGHFPGDLSQRNLEYSGIYEDAFVGDDAVVWLSQPAGTTRLVLDGAVPTLGDAHFATDVVLTVDGKEVLRRRLSPGEFTLSADVPPAASTHNRAKIGLAFSRLQHLPAPDGRPIAAQLSRVGFVPSPSSVVWSVRDRPWHGLQYSGIFEDGWMGPAVSIRLGQPADAGRLVVRGTVPTIDDAHFSTDVVLTVDGREVARKTVGPGDFEIAADLPGGPAERNVALSFSKLQRLPSPDTRTVGGQLKSVGFERASGDGSK